MNTREAYPTDLTGEQWMHLQALLPAERTRSEQAREYLNGLLYVLHSGCAWRLL